MLKRDEGATSRNPGLPVTCTAPFSWDAEEQEARPALPGLRSPSGRCPATSALPEPTVGGTRPSCLCPVGAGSTGQRLELTQ